MVYVIVAVPILTPVTKPVGLTMAIAVLDDNQGVVAFAVEEPVNCEVPIAQVINVPVIVGNALTVKVAVLDVIEIVPELVNELTTQV